MIRQTRCSRRFSRIGIYAPVNIKDLLANIWRDHLIGRRFYWVEWQKHMIGPAPLSKHCRNRETSLFYILDSTLRILIMEVLIPHPLTAIIKQLEKNRNGHTRALSEQLRHLRLDALLILGYMR